MALALAAAAQADTDTVIGHQREQPQQGHPAPQAPLLGDQREDKVGLLLRQEIEMTLGSIKEAFTEQPA